MKIAILYTKVLNDDGSATIGGIQTYIHQLCDVITNLKWMPKIFQISNAEFEHEWNKIKVSGIKLNSKNSAKNIGAILVKSAENWFGKDDGIIIFATDTIANTTNYPSIAIQHGVWWDTPETGKSHHKENKLHVIRKKILGIKFFQEIKNYIANSYNQPYASSIKCNNLVCVDYNFYNCAKSLSINLSKNLWIIPNTSSTYQDSINKDDSITRIIFARRFFPYRGTRLIAPVFKTILKKHAKISITFAGEGPDERWLKDYFKNESRIDFIKYKQGEEFEILKNHHISVIPSLGSEGTSISAIEAMSTDCAIVATCVGGMTNIIIDEYNGLLVTPTEKNLFSAIDRLICNKSLRTRLATNAKNTVTEALNIKTWERKWIQVLLEVKGNNN